MADHGSRVCHVLGPLVSETDSDEGARDTLRGFLCFSSIL